MLLRAKVVARLSVVPCSRKVALIQAPFTAHNLLATPAGAAGVIAYPQNGGTIEHAQQIANHESPRTTKLYDRTNDASAWMREPAPLFRASSAS